MGAAMRNSKIVVILVVAALSACGANGAPERPSAGMAISGEVAVGIAKNGS